MRYACEVLIRQVAMADLTPSGYIGIDEAIAAFCERMYRDVPESNLVQKLRKSGLLIGSADRHAGAIEALRRAVLRGSLGVFVWHSGMLSATALARLRMLDRRTFFLRTGHVRAITCSGRGIWRTYQGLFWCGVPFRGARISHLARPEREAEANIARRTYCPIGCPWPSLKD